MKRVTAIVPAFNEEKKILGVLHSLLKSSSIDEIIVVNDGSTDRTSEIVNSFPQIKLIINRKNSGKGYSIARGIEKAKGEIILFVDADIYGLNQSLIDSLISPLQKGECDFTIGYRSSRMEKSVGVPLGGERAYFKKDLMPHIKKIESKAYGALELYLNYFFKNKKRKIINLKGVYSAPKHKKYSYALATKLYVHETYKVLDEIFARKDSVSYFKNSYLDYVYFRDRNVVEYMQIKRFLRNYKYLRLPF